METPDPVVNQQIMDEASWYRPKRNANQRKRKTTIEEIDPYLSSKQSGLQEGDKGAPTCLSARGGASTPLSCWIISKFLRGCGWI